MNHHIEAQNGGVGSMLVYRPIVRTGKVDPTLDRPLALTVDSDLMALAALAAVVAEQMA